MAPVEDEENLATAGVCGFCWKIDVAATERLKEERRGSWPARRRKAEENSLAGQVGRFLCELNVQGLG